jgi:hypothetical protein
MKAATAFMAISAFQVVRIYLRVIGQKNLSAFSTSRKPRVMFRRLSVCNITACFHWE